MKAIINGGKCYDFNDRGTNERRAGFELHLVFKSDEYFGEGTCIGKVNLQSSSWNDFEPYLKNPQELVGKAVTFDRSSNGKNIIDIAFA